ncbi:hypothetical protein [Thalassomonas actiniarum]|uniref:hypothetical protein n=1 Tax=Thalassomonas actiniarum TaxID=485447 RepID=UPI001F270434|nr:hypothetical protein [Thalassomonas actiniarum]
MATLTPILAVELAKMAYAIQKPLSGGIYRVEPTQMINRHFSFDLTHGPLKGISGGAMAHYQQKSTGFALIGNGKGEFFN